ncbi:cation diffusion facilitator family transporter [Clostridium felsineum]|uniref:cation diffusion facilitator family transporter n=1 Tax=Clostridium felsineum TaxID=36839 RepID=UPI00098C599A|nr:cation diffusion facilitator family transporter [Clostridium felsineum]URZ15695.1 Ferrous-iron efflux pump FieF [Clostridium felsineum DSM 794]
MDKKNSAVLSIISNTTLIIFKLTAGITMNSISVISDGIHSSIDLIASLVSFFSIKKSSLKEDDDHPFGHGKYENVSGFVEAILILFAAIMIIYEAFNKLISNSAINNVDSGIYIMVFSSVINFVISSIILKTSKKTKSIALEVDAMHLFTDAFTSLGVILGLILFKFTNIKIIDSITAFFVSILIIKTAINLIKKSLKDLVDSSLDKTDINRIVNIVKNYPNIKSYHKLRTRKCGNTREIDIHIQISGTDSLKKTHDICSSIENEIKKVFPDSCTVIHAEPYTEKFHKKSLT